jgi:D-alanyl-D-alanine carboxypeptidase
LDKSGLPNKPSQGTKKPTGDDIPVALRETSPPSRQNPWQPVLLIGGLLAAGTIIGAIVWLNNPQFRFLVAASPSPLTSSATPSPTVSAQENVLGHLPYQEATAAELQPITADGRIRMRTAAAKKFQEMVADARNSGAIIVPISGFRTVAEQQHLFFDVKAQRGEVTSKRAEVSAPPGYSEHHTGYAVDIGDGNVPATNLSPTFEKTAAFKWMQANAARYSFELSFPQHNPQGVSYEPWHWRFVGDRPSLETFYKAKNLKVVTPTPRP